MDADIQELRERFLNKSFDEKTFNIDPAITTEYARLSGELSEKYLDTNHPDFQAPPTYLACLSGRRSMPEDFPRFGFGMDAGKGIECFVPVRPGQALVGRTHLHDIYTKTGRSGRMIFVVTRIEFYDEAGVHVANSDSRSVMREKKA
jgi:hypothetical protein